MLKNILPEKILRLLDKRNDLIQLGLPPARVFDRSVRAALSFPILKVMPYRIWSTMDTIVDVGANIGDFSYAMSVLSSAKYIYAYEPNAAVAKDLRKRCSEISGFKLIEAAVGEENGEIVLLIEENTGMSSVLTMKDETRQLYPMLSKPPKSTTVPVVTLDDQLRDVNEISFLKMDIQGYEYSALKGALSILKRTRFLSFEVALVPQYENESQFNEIHEFISRNSNLKIYSATHPALTDERVPLSFDIIYSQ